MDMESFVMGLQAGSTTDAKELGPTVVANAYTSVENDYGYIGTTDARTYIYPFGLAIAKFYFRITNNPGTTERTIATTTIKPIHQVGMTVTSQEGTYCAIFIAPNGNIQINSKATNANGTYHIIIVYPVNV